MVYKKTYHILPFKLRKKLKKLLDYSYINVEPESFIGFIVIFGILFAIAASFYLNLLFNVNPIYSGVIILIAFYIFIFIWLNLSADKKAEKVEEILPDALLLIASNLRAGYPIDKALIFAARPEFHILSYELGEVGKKVAMGIDLDIALRELSARIKSKELERTIELMIEGIRGGGNMANLIEGIAINIRKKQLIQKKIKASIAMYGIFIGIVVCVAAPLLLAEASYIAKIISERFSSITLPPGSFFTFSTLFAKARELSETLLIYLSLALLFILSFFGSIIIGIIFYGKERKGFKFLIPFFLASSFVFYLVRKIIGNVISSMMG